jgi:Holliday junction resolvase-like predicted endonuclease
MNITQTTRKDIGNIGESVAAEYLKRHDFCLIDRNYTRKTGEIDIIAQKGDTLHFVEVKALVCNEFPNPHATYQYDPSDNLHAYKITKVARTAAWYSAEKLWEGEWQIDGILVWIRRRDGMAFVRYLEQIL